VKKQPTTVILPTNPVTPVPSSNPVQANPGQSQQTTVTIPAAGPAPKRKGGGGGIMKILLILFVVALVGIGGWFGWSMISANKQVTISYWGLWENESIIRPIITDFEAQNPTIKVEYVKQSQKQYRERLTAAIARGEGPDAYRFHNTWVSMLKNELSPAPADVITADEFASTYYPVAKNDLVGGANIYGLPLMFDGLGLYINEDIFSASGATPPTTWEDVLALVPTLTVRNGTEITTSAIALGTTNNVENFSDIIATMIMQNGGKLVSPTGTPAEEALLFFRKFADPSDPVYTWNATFDNSVYAFATGRVAMIIAPSWRAFDVKQIAPTANFKIVPIPQLPGNTVNWASYWAEGVSTKSKYQKQAWQFVKFLTSKESAVKLYTEAAKNRLFGEPYARVDMASLLAGDPYAETYVKEAPTAKSFPLASRTFDNGLNDKLIKYLEDAVNSVQSGESPTAALNTASGGFNQVFSQYGLTTAAPANTTK
jgi:multiple sugar transport system substrate-binding protein